MTKNTISLLSLAIAAIIVATGCESSENSAVSWNDSSSSADTSTSTSDSTSGSTSASDQVPFSSLQWTYGGINGSGASHSGVNISGMRISGPATRSGSVSWKFDSDLSNWGVSYTDHTHAYFCFFIKEKDGVWRGGKLDWISSSRTSRDFHNIEGKYQGWTMANAGNPTQVAMLILNKDCKRRSNVITATWSR